MAIYIDTVPNRNSRPTILLREAWREGKRIRKRTIGNLTRLPPGVVEGIRQVLKGGVVVDRSAAVQVRRSLPHGHACAVLGLCRELGLPRILSRRACRERDLALGAIICQVLDPGSKLATARRLSQSTASSSLGAALRLGEVRGAELLAMLDWLLARQRWIETSLANRHLENGALILYDATSSYLEGRCRPLAAFGHNRDGKKGKKQILFGLLCAANGCPVAVEVFSGDTGDPRTVAAQIEKIRERFRIDRVALAGDRGMLTTARIRADLEPARLDWVSALRTVDLRTLLRTRVADSDRKELEPEALVPDGVVEIVSTQFPGERLMVRLNPRLRDERARKRAALLDATEAELISVAQRVRNPRSPLRAAPDIRAAVERGIRRYKVAKHFDVVVGDGVLEWTRNEDRIVAEARLDGVYIIRTSLDAADLAAHDAVEAYKALTRVERAFHAMKLTRLEVRPVYVYTADHVRAHVFLCALAYYVEWHLRQRLAPAPFAEDDPQAAKAKRASPVAPAEASDRAVAKARTKTTPDGLPVHSMTTLLADLATITLNRVRFPSNPDHEFEVVSELTPLQRKVFDLLNVDPKKTYPV